MRIQFEVSDTDLKLIECLMEQTGIKTRRNLLNSAVALFAWVVKERKAGKIVISLDENNKKVRELVMPALSGL